jgi:hypothetical protein
MPVSYFERALVTLRWKGREHQLLARAAVTNNLAMIHLMVEDLPPDYDRLHRLAGGKCEQHYFLSSCLQPVDATEYRWICTETIDLDSYREANAMLDEIADEMTGEDQGPAT